MNTTLDLPYEYRHEVRCSRWIGAMAVMVGLLIAATMHAFAAPAQRLVRECVAFEDLPLDTRYDVNNSFASEGRNFSILKFTGEDGEVIDGGFVEVEDEAMAGGSGQDLEANNANLEVELPTAVQGIVLRYGEYGGNLNLRVNGDFRNFDAMIEIDGEVIGGADVSVLDLDGELESGPGILDVRAPLGGSITEFGIGGQEFFVDDVCVYTEDDEPDADDPSPAARDLGDAPDSTNHVGIANSAYPGAGVNGSYPTVWQSAAGPSGPMHQNGGRQALLGNALSREREADAGFDADGANNILNGGADNANNDHFDDGWRNRGILLADCRRATLRVRVRKAAAATLEKMFLNVWFDGTRDGDWDDTGVCLHPETGHALRSFEWIVQDFGVDLTAIAPGGFVDIPVNTELVMNLEPQKPHWLRFTLSERPAVHPPSGGLADGRGPAHPDHYEFGETEDYFQREHDGGAPGDLSIEKSVQTRSVPVHPGDHVLYTLDLKHEGGDAPAETEMIDELPRGVHTTGRISVTEQAPNVAPLTAYIDRHKVAWRGALTPGGHLRIAFPARVRRCYGGDLREIGNIAAALDTDHERIEDGAAFAVQCIPVNIGDISVVQRLVADPSDPAGNTILENGPEAPPAIFPGDSAHIRTDFTNHGEETVVLGFLLEISGVRAVAAEVGPTSGRGFQKVELAPGETHSHYLTIPAGALVLTETLLTAEEEPGLDDEPAVEVRTTYCLVDDYDTACPSEGEVEQVAHTIPLTFRFIRADLGDAPDSTNHYGVTMTAYISPSAVQAEFPTVFEAATGLPRGPRHARSRPFHLGELVSWEWGADVGADQDLINNLAPILDQANLDRHDDGANPPTWTLQHCRTTEVEVRVFISPLAVDYFKQLEKPGYLNGWIDGLRDGDWNDAVECQNDQGQTASAVEHAIIDFPIDVVALGAGLHTLSVPTGRVLWPAELADRPAWVRLTLSEQPSNKTLTAIGITYGDGRGYDKPFRLGETEDSLWRPANHSGGVDVGIRKTGRVFQEFDPEEDRVVTKIAWLVEFGNRGDREAANVVIRDTLGQDQKIIAILIGLLNSRSDVPQERDGDAIVFHVGALGPGEHGRITIITKVEPDTPELRRYTNRAEIRAVDDANAGNNVAEAAVVVGVRPPRILSPVDGTTCDPVVEITGRSEANATVDIYVDGVLAATVVANEEGHWQQTLELSDGRHAISATATIGDMTSPPSQVARLIVNISLPWDPISLTFTNENGRSRRPVDADGRTDETGWSLNLRPNMPYTATVRICCEEGAATVTLFIEGIGDIALTDGDGDGIYTGVFTTGPRNPEAVRMSLTIVCGETEVTGSGTVILIDPAGTVYDVTTGAALADAMVACMQGEGDFFTLWDAESFDQVNPQGTLADGFFSFLTPPGAYRFDVSRAGYQPYRSPTLDVVSDPVLYDAPLTPIIDEAADHRIEISEFGYEPAVLAVKPGDVIEWVNLDGDGHSTTSFKEAGAAATSVGEVAWDSGLLATGESYKFRAGAEGVYAYSDRANAANSATLIVDDGADGPGLDISVFLPLVNQ
jgi:plastocyanin